MLLVWISKAYFLTHIFLFQKHEKSQKALNDVTFDNKKEEKVMKFQTMFVDG